MLDFMLGVAVVCFVLHPITFLFYSCPTDRLLASPWLSVTVSNDDPGFWGVDGVRYCRLMVVLLGMNVMCLFSSFQSRLVRCHLGMGFRSRWSKAVGF